MNYVVLFNIFSVCVCVCDACGRILLSKLFKLETKPEQYHFQL